jgi:hypothetical protein
MKIQIAVESGPWHIVNKRCNNGLAHAAVLETWKNIKLVLSSVTVLSMSAALSDSEDALARLYREVLDRPSRDRVWPNSA